MKQRILSGIVGLVAVTLLSGCVFAIGSGPKGPQQNVPTLGQQLSDLKTAKDHGAISDADYEIQKAKLLRK